MGNRHHYARMEYFLPFLIQVWLYLIVIGGQTLIKKRWFFGFAFTTRLFDKATSTIIAKLSSCWFLVNLRNGQNVTARFALKTFETTFIVLFRCMETDTLLLWTIHSRTGDISDKILNWFLCLFKIMKHLVTLQENWICFIFKRHITHLTSRRTLKTW